MRKISTLIFIVTSILFSSCSNKEYGEELSKDGVQLFYTDKVTKEEANNLLSYLVEEGFSDGTTKTVQLNKSGNTYEFRMVVKKGIEQDEEYITLFKDLTLELSERVFNNNPVDLHLCDEELETIRVIPMNYLDDKYEDNSNSSQTFDKNEERNQNYSQNSYPKDLVQNFMNECMKNGGSQTRCSCALNKIEEKYNLSEYLEIENAMKNNNTPKEFLNFIQSVQSECSEQ